MADTRARQRVYVDLRQGDRVVPQVLDLSYFAGEPIAVISWVLKDGALRPGDYVRLDPRRLRPSGAGTYRYEDVVQDPRVPPAPRS